MIDLLHQAPASPLQSQGEPDTGSDDQTELSRYKRLYTRAREDLEKLNGQAKRRWIQAHPSIPLTEITSKENC